MKLTFVFKPSETKTAELLSVNSTGKHFTIFTFANFHLQGRLADHEYKNFLEIARKRTLDVVDLYRAQMQAKFIYQLKIWSYIQCVRFLFNCIKVGMMNLVFVLLNYLFFIYWFFQLSLWLKFYFSNDIRYDHDGGKRKFFCRIFQKFRRIM